MNNKFNQSGKKKKIAIKYLEILNFARLVYLGSFGWFNLANLRYPSKLVC